MYSKNVTWTETLRNITLLILINVLFLFDCFQTNFRWANYPALEGGIRVTEFAELWIFYSPMKYKEISTGQGEAGSKASQNGRRLWLVSNYIVSVSIFTNACMLRFIFRCNSCGSVSSDSLRRCYMWGGHRLPSQRGWPRRGTKNAGGKEVMFLLCVV